MTSFKITSNPNLELHNISAESVHYRGKDALQIIEHGEIGSGKALAIIPDSRIGDCVIETEIAGSVLSDAPEAMRGFVGIAFHVQPNGEQYECFYIRPTNGRADDQLRRNHATQYISYPDFPWFKLREEYPGVYESYTDLVPDEWTAIKIVVKGTRAELYVNGAEQPCLIVNDLKLGNVQGQVGLWIGLGTQAHFSDIQVTPL